jgi:hypothetical protein
VTGTSAANAAPKQGVGALAQTEGEGPPVPVPPGAPKASMCSTVTPAGTVNVCSVPVKVKLDVSACATPLQMSPPSSATPMVPPARLKIFPPNTSCALLLDAEASP